MAFPHYHAPEIILPYKNGINMYKKYFSLSNVSLKRKIVLIFEYIIMKYLKAKFFAPAIIAIAKK